MQLKSIGIQPKQVFIPNMVLSSSVKKLSNLLPTNPFLSTIAFDFKLNWKKRKKEWEQLPNLLEIQVFKSHDL